MLCNACQHFGADFIAIMEGENKIRQPLRASVLCEPDCRLICQPSRNTQREGAWLERRHWLMPQRGWKCLWARAGFRHAQAVQHNAKCENLTLDIASSDVAP